MFDNRSVLEDDDTLTGKEEPKEPTPEPSSIDELEDELEKEPTRPYRTRPSRDSIELLPT